MSGTAPTLDAAIALHARFNADLKNPSVPPSEQPEKAGAWTLGEAYDRTVATRWTGKKSADTAIINADIVVAFFKRSRKLSTIDTDAIDGFVAHLIFKGNSDGTINRKLSALSTMMTVAHDRKKLDSKPKMPWRKESKGRIRFLTDEEETVAFKLLRQWDKLDEVDACEVLIDTGIRVGELNNMEPRDINHQRTAVSVWENKSSLPRTVPLTSRAYSILKRRCITQHNQKKLFPYHDQWLRHTWDRVRDTMGLTEDDQFVIHALRHTFASRLVQRNTPLQVVQQLLGHKDIKQTMRYAHLCPANLEGAVALLEPQKRTITLEELIARARAQGLEIAS
jgi:integrase